MSLGGLTAIRLGATRPDLVRKALLVDVTPGSPEAARRMNAAGRAGTGPGQTARPGDSAAERYGRGSLGTMTTGHRAW